MKNATILIIPMLQGAAALQQPVATRRQTLDTLSGMICASAGLVITGPNDCAFAADEIAFENRDRNGNKDALIREDYWFMTGKTPPRLLTNPLQAEDPKWATFGSCDSADGGNPCTYVSLKQRAPAYSKYGSTIAQGAKEYAALGKILQSSSPAWDQALPLIRGDLGSAAVDAELKMILLATALLVSPNFPTPNKELLVSRYYANEIHFAQGKVRTAVEEQNREQALAAWEFGRDAWNSYFQVVNRSISPKVGDKFELIL